MLKSLVDLELHNFLFFRKMLILQLIECKKMVKMNVWSLYTDHKLKNIINHRLIITTTNLSIFNNIQLILTNLTLTTHSCMAHNWFFTQPFHIIDTYNSKRILLNDRVINYSPTSFIYCRFHNKKLLFKFSFPWKS